jgi:hypothetical protein
MTINNNNIFGAFTLNDARGSRLTGDWLNKESVANYGWFGGGLIPATPTPLAVSTVERIDFSNDSIAASVRGSLSVSKYASAATGNSNYGWFAGGILAFPLVSATGVTTVDRIDFSNDSGTASPRGPLSLGRALFASAGNSNYGWFGGGAIIQGTLLSTVDRIDFSNDASTASVRGSLSLTRSQFAATGNSNYGWFGSGQSGGTQFSTVDRIDFSNDFLIASPRGPLSLARDSAGATGNSNYGWFAGGSVPTQVSTVDRIDFSNDSVTASVRGPLSSTRYRMGASANSNYGWFGGGGLPVTGAVDRIDFSNDTGSASPRGGTLPIARYGLAATSGVLNIRRQKAGNYGWFGGGLNPSVSAVVDRIDFSNDLNAASPRGSLLTSRYNLAATGNSNYGWFGGGAIPTPAVVSTVDRIDFSNDSPTALTRGPLSAIKYNPAATGNSNYGWFGGGQSSGSVYYSTVERINFSNDSATASPRTTFTGVPANGITRQAATGNSNYGWFGGGSVPSVPLVRSTVYRLDFSNDSSTISTRGPLSAARYKLTATGNSNYGWYAGGFTPGSPSQIATVDRIDFSNDSVSASPRSPLASARYLAAATGNSNYGWFGGGTTSGAPFNPISSVERMNFSNDSATASIRGALNAPTGRTNHAATSNTPIG